MQDLVSNRDSGTLRRTTSVSVVRCINSTYSSIKCKSAVEIEKAMVGVRISFFFINNNWQAGYKFPVVPFFDNRLEEGVVSGIQKK